MTDTVRTERTSALTLVLSIVGTLALVCLLALAPTFTEAQALTIKDASNTTYAAGDLPPVGAAFARTEEVRLATPDTGEDEAETIYVRHIWTCGQDYLGLAPADGSLSEWAPHYFVAHSYGPYGQAILSLEVGDMIVVNGNLVTVEGAVSAPKFSPYQQIMETVGWDATVLQTCIPDTESCLFVYARGDTSTLEAANEARAFAGLAPYVNEATASQVNYVNDTASGGLTGQGTYDPGVASDLPHWHSLGIGVRDGHGNPGQR